MQKLRPYRLCFFRSPRRRSLQQGALGGAGGSAAGGCSALDPTPCRAGSPPTAQMKSTCIKYVLMLKSSGDLIFHPSFYLSITFCTRPLGTGGAQPCSVPRGSISAFTTSPAARPRPGWALPTRATNTLPSVCGCQRGFPRLGCSKAGHSSGGGRLSLLGFSGLRHVSELRVCFARGAGLGLQAALGSGGNPRCLTPVIWAPVDNRLRFEGAFKASQGQLGDDFRPLRCSMWHSVGKDPFH